MTRTIALTGARGGQGTSTVAAALAVLAADHGTSSSARATRQLPPPCSGSVPTRTSGRASARG